MRFEILLAVVIVALAAGEVGAINHYLIAPLLAGINGALTVPLATF